MSVLSLPRSGFRRLRNAGWQVKAGIVLAALVIVPILFLAAIYFLPADTAVSLGKPLLAALSDSPPLPDDLDPVSERSVLLAADGSEIATLYDDVNRVRVSLDDVADVAIDALLAAEDDAFYEHPGIDHQAVIRAALVNVRSGGIEQGGSTLTQQLVKNVYLDSSQTARRKFTEAWYALELEDRLPKDAILERYLNEAYFGKGAYGIGAAAELYFNTTAADLDAAQAATLVAIIPAPGDRNPVDNPDEARRFRNVVLDRMVAAGRLEEAEATQARNADLGIDYTPLPPPEEPFFVSYVRDRLLNDPRFDDAFGTDEALRERVIYGGGLTVHTTLNPGLQDLAHEVIEERMGDADSSPLATIVSLQPHTGEIKAMAVGPHEFGTCKKDKDDCGKTEVNPAVSGLGGSGRQPGSAFKPFVLTTALDADVPRGWEQRTKGGVEIDGCENDGEAYKPENYSEDPGIKDMREAIRVSNNVYHAKLAGLLGPDAIASTAEQVGLTGDLPQTCSVALGSGSVFPLAMAGAYSTFANEGSHCDPMAVTKIEFGRQGNDVLEFEPQCEERLDPGLAAQVTDLLRAPVENGTATDAQLDRPVAGKTGTTDDYRDAWFVGYVPQLVTATWIGFEQPEPMEDILGVELVTGGTVPVDLWKGFMEPVVSGFSVEQFPDVEGREQVEMPDFTDEDIDKVRDDYDGDFSLNIETEKVKDYRDAGTIVDQSVDPGTEVDAGKLLRLAVSNGKGKPPRVPDVVGMTEDDAVDALADADYDDVEVQEETREIEKGRDLPVKNRTVVAMDPEGGSRLKPNKTVTLVVVVFERVPAEDDEDAEQQDNGNGGDDDANNDDADNNQDDENNGNGNENDGDGDGDGSDDDPTPDTGNRNGRVRFTRIVANPDGDDLERNGGEFVRLASGQAPVDVSGWTIEYEGGRTLEIGEGYAMAAGSTLDVHTGPGTDRPPRRYFNGRDREVLLDSGGVLILRDDRGREVSRVEY